MVTFDMPSASSTLAAATDMSTGFFDEYAIPVIGLTLGLLVAALAIKWLSGSVKGFLKTVFGGRKGNRRRR